MNLYSPLAEMSRIQQDMNRLFGAFDSPLTGRGFTTPSVRRYPLINLYEDDNEYRVEALAPGFDPEKFEVSLVENRLSISGEHDKQEEEIKPENYLRNERFHGKFTRTFELPGEVDSENVTADYKHGVLNVHIPKGEKQKPRSIKVNFE